jgi:RimJ/RimL family protein N-acetyltransferase
MILRIPLHSESLVLRQLEPAEVTEKYLSWLRDPEINRYLEVRFSPPETLQELRRFVDSVNASKDSLLLGIFILPEEQHIGNIKLGPIDRNHLVADIGILIGDRDEWGKGHASVAISLLSDYAFGELGLAKLTAGYYAENQGSEKAFLRAGYAVEGKRLSQWQVGEQRQDGILLGKVNPSFTS